MAATGSRSLSDRTTSGSRKFNFAWNGSDGSKNFVLSQRRGGNDFGSENLTVVRGKQISIGSKTYTNDKVRISVFSTFPNDQKFTFVRSKDSKKFEKTLKPGNDNNAQIKITKANPNVTITPTPTNGGKSVDYVVTAANPYTSVVIPSGTVTVRLNGGTAQNLSLDSAGKPKLSQSLTGTTQQSFTATYNGDSTHNTGTYSASLVYTGSLSANKTSMEYGEWVELTARSSDQFGNQPWFTNVQFNYFDSPSSGTMAGGVAKKSYQPGSGTARFRVAQFDNNFQNRVTFTPNDLEIPVSKAARVLVN